MRIRRYALLSEVFVESAPTRPTDIDPAADDAHQEVQRTFSGNTLNAATPTVLGIHGLAGIVLLQPPRLASDSADPDRPTGLSGLKHRAIST